jgi:primosomal replication protein N
VNQLVLSVQLLERGALRYTPAGIEALDLVLKHESQATEAGVSRKVALELRAVALGAIVKSLARLDIGSCFDVSGFLSAQRNGRGIVFHLTAVH